MEVSGHSLLSQLRAGAQLQAPVHRRECFLQAELQKQTALVQAAGVYCVFQGPGLTLRAHALFNICSFCCGAAVLQLL